MIVRPPDLARIASSGLVREVEFHAEIGSTNDRAAELAFRPGLASPFLVLAERQTAGRGRGSNRWWSSPGSLTFSLVLEGRQCGLPVQRWPQIALAAGAAVCEAIEQVMPAAPAGLKWPNDVYLAGKKAGGILVEAPAGPAGRVIVGIGLNVNNSLARAPADVARQAASMIDVAGHPFDSTEVLLAILARFADVLSKAAANEHDLVERCRRWCLLSGKRVTLSLGGRDVTGICRGIDDQGRLMLATSEGTERYLSGTVIAFEEPRTK
jgi:BirA family transcriptional regulator, biotin operon repressor / biotin---[acetyl-CoA-carboxylase] ligase